MLLGTVSMLGFGTMLMGELPRHRGAEGPMISSALVTVGGTGVLLGVLFALLAPQLSSDLRPLSTSIWSVGLYASGVALAAIALVIDLALIGLLRGGLQFTRNSLFAVVKLAFLALLSVWAAATFGLSIYATWAGGNAISLLYLAVIVARRRHQQPLRPQWTMMKSVGRTALAHHLLNLTLQAPTMMLPLIVTVVLSTAANAAFYIAWMIAGFLFIGPISLSLVLYAADAAEPHALEHKTRLTLGTSLVIGVVGEGLLILMSGTALRVFGPTYAARAGLCLPILGVGVFGMAIKDHYVTLRRIQGRVLRAAAAVAAGDVLEIAGAATGAALAGLTGLSIGFVLALCIEGLLLSKIVAGATGILPRRTSMVTTSRLDTVEEP